MTEEEKEKFKPAVEELKTAPELMSEAIKRKYEFDAHFATIVGVLFGVLAAFNSIGECQCADIFYIIGITSCAICFVLCVICLYQPISANKHLREVKALKASTKLLQSFIPDDDSTKELKQALAEAEKKSFDWFKLYRVCSYVLFAVSLLSVLINIYIRYTAIAY